MSIGGTDVRYQKSDQTRLYGNNRWVRPGDWLTLPTVTSSEQKVVILAAVFDAPMNYFSVQVSGAFTVDWGDGTSAVNYTTGTNASKNLLWSSYNSSTLTSKGYRQAIITVTMQSGQNLTALSFGTRDPALVGASPGVGSAALEVIASAPNLTSGLSFGSNSNVIFPLMERVAILNINSTSTYQLFQNYHLGLRSLYYSGAAALTDTRNMFSGCYNLVDVNIRSKIGVGCDGGSMFSDCRSLETAPELDFGASGYFWTLTGHFNNCYALKNVYSYPTASTTIFTNMFLNCRSLISAPIMTTTAATAMDGMFNGCSVLSTVPKYDLNGVTTTASMFSGCLQLDNIPDFDVSTVQNISGMFSSCSKLSSLPSSFATTTAATNTSNMLTSCTSLSSIPTIDTSIATNVSNMLTGCQSLKVVPALNFNSVTSSTNMSGVFPTNNTSLSKISALNYKYTFSVGTNLLNVSGIEEVFNNLTRVTSAQTVTISGNIGANTYAKTATTTSGSYDLTSLSDTTSLTTGMFATATNLASTKAVTFQDAGDTVTLTAHGLSDGKKVAFSAITTTTGILINTTYYVVNATTDTFQLAATAGGTALTLTNDGSGTIMLVYIVTNISGSTVTLDVPASASGVTQTITFRALDVSIARFKGWTVSG